MLGTLALSGVTAGFITAGQRGWLSPLPGLLLAAGLTAGWWFLRAERRQRDPVLPLALFRSRPFGGAVGIGLLFNLILYGTLLCLSLFLQEARHEPVLTTGLLLLPMSSVVGLGSLASGRLTARFGPRRPMLAGLTLAAAASLAATAMAPLPLFIAASALLGLVSLAMPAMVGVAVDAAGPESAGVASGILNAARQSGGALGVALLGSLLGSGEGAGHPLNVCLPLAAATAGYLLATAVAWFTIREISGKTVAPPPGATIDAGRKGAGEKLVDACAVAAK